MKKIAFQFPAGFAVRRYGKALAAEHAPARLVFEEADEALVSPSQNCVSTGRKGLKLTEKQHPAAADRLHAALAVLREKDRPRLLADTAWANTRRWGGGRSSLPQPSACSQAGVHAERSLREWARWPQW